MDYCYNRTRSFKPHVVLCETKDHLPTKVTPIFFNLKHRVLKAWVFSCYNFIAPSAMWSFGVFYLFSKRGISLFRAFYHRSVLFVWSSSKQLVTKKSFEVEKSAFGLRTVPIFKTRNTQLCNLLKRRKCHNSISMTWWLFGFLCFFSSILVSKDNCCLVQCPV